MTVKYEVQIATGHDDAFCPPTMTIDEVDFAYTFADFVESCGEDADVDLLEEYNDARIRGDSSRWGMLKAMAERMCPDDLLGILANKPLRRTVY